MSSSPDNDEPLPESKLYCKSSLHLMASESIPTISSYSSILFNLPDTDDGPLEVLGGGEPGEPKDDSPLEVLGGGEPGEPKDDGSLEALGGDKLNRDDAESGVR